MLSRTEVHARASVAYLDLQVVREVDTGRYHLDPNMPLDKSWYGLIVTDAQHARICGFAQLIANSCFHVDVIAAIQCDKNRQASECVLRTRCLKVNLDEQNASPKLSILHQFRIGLLVLGASSAWYGLCK